MIKLLLVDDEPHIRRGLRMRLALEPDLVVVGEAGDGAEAADLARSLRPDVVLMDVSMQGLDGIAATAAVRAACPEVAVVILSLEDGARIRAQAEAAGAAAFIAKHEAIKTLIPTLRRIGLASGHTPED
jgi:DNA-binding NarL/FixJ family response regulator